MPRYSIIVESGGKAYATQIKAGSVQKAFENFLDRQYNRHGPSILGEGAPSALSAADIISLIAMDDLTNLWSGQAGRAGKTVSAILVRTVAKQGP